MEIYSTFGWPFAQLRLPHGGLSSIMLCIVFPFALFSSSLTSLKFLILTQEGPSVKLQCPSIFLDQFLSQAEFEQTAFLGRQEERKGMFLSLSILVWWQMSDMSLSSPLAPQSWQTWLLKTTLKISWLVSTLIKSKGSYPYWILDIHKCFINHFSGILQRLLLFKVEVIFQALNTRNNILVAFFNVTHSCKCSLRKLHKRGPTG